MERQAAVRVDSVSDGAPPVARRSARIVGDGPRATVATGMVKRVVLMAPSGAALRRAFEPLIGELKRRRHGVLCIAAEFAPADAAALEALGVEQQRWPVGAPRLKLLAEWAASAELNRILRDWRPHVLVAASPQQIADGALAARRAGVERVVAMIGGTIENGDSPNGLAPPATRRYRRALEACDAAVFRHREGQKALAAAGILPPKLPTSVVSGTGVDLNERQVVPLPPFGDGLVFLTAAKLERASGVLDFAAAASIVKRVAPSARFLLAGVPSSSIGAVSLAEIDAIAGAGVIEHVGADDVAAACARCHVLIDPARSGNGSPLPVIEAMAAGRPVIVSDIPGHRDTVDDRVNGCMVPAGDATALAAAIESFLRRPDLIPAAARASRAKAERRFDRRELNRALLAVLGLE